jgi:DNA mismatch repair protein MutS2
LETLALREALNNTPTSWGSKIAHGLLNAEEPLSAIEQIVSPNGDIRNDASETIFNLINEKSKLARQIQHTLERVVKDHDIDDVLQEKFVTTREGRWVIPIKSGLQSHFAGIIHASSQSRQTVFMEPEAVIPVNNRLRQVEVEIEDEIERLLSELSSYLNSLAKEFETTKSLLLQADIRLSQAQLAVTLGAQPCEFSDHEFELKELRHPILILNKVNVIPNDVELDAKNKILLLSGPNAGGKTVLLKSIGLAAQMSRAGLWIPAAAGSKLPFFKKIITAIGDEQSVDKHLSTFAAHLKSLNTASKAVGHHHLILVDEICGSTDPEEGSALARSFIERFSKNGVTAIITSHLGALKSDWDENSGVIHGSLEFDKKSGPTYSLLMGIPGQSLAILTAKSVGVDQEILDGATRHLSPERRQYQRGLEEVDEMRAGLRKLEAEMRSQKKAAEKAKEKYTLELKKIETDRENILSKTAHRAQKRVEEIIETAQVKDVFKRHSEIQKLKADLPEIIKTSPTQAAKNLIQSPEDFAKKFPAGSKVFIASFGQDGLVQSQPNSKGDVVVLSKSMRITVPWQELRSPENPGNPTRDLLKRSGSFQFSPIDEDRVVDIRGLTSEEAIEQLELQLDTAALQKEDRVKIIHGHGTETLKRAVRSYLSRSVYIGKWQAGTKESGGDGITWAEIKSEN